MKTVFVDSNIILDVLLQNEGFWQDSHKIFKLAELGHIRAFVSATCVRTEVIIKRHKKLDSNDRGKQ